MKQAVCTLGYAAVFAALLIAPAGAQDVKVGDLVISQAWSRATPGGAKVAGGYLNIENKGAAADRLVGGSADVAGKFKAPRMGKPRSLFDFNASDYATPTSTPSKR